MFNFGDTVDNEPATVDFRQNGDISATFDFVDRRLSTLSPVCTGPY